MMQKSAKITTIISLYERINNIMRGNMVEFMLTLNLVWMKWRQSDFMLKKIEEHVFYLQLYFIYEFYYFNFLLSFIKKKIF